MELIIKIMTPDTQDRSISVEYPQVPQIGETFSYRQLSRTTDGQRKCRTVDILITGVKHVLIRTAGAAPETRLAKLEGTLIQEVEN